MIYNTN